MPAQRGTAIKPYPQATLSASEQPKAKFCLDVGCGYRLQPGFIGMDKRKLPGVDIVHDLEVIPWPLTDEQCDVVMMSHVVEHIKPWLVIDVFNEIWRITKPNGLLLISTPHAMSQDWHKDPTHCSPWMEVTPYYFCPEHPAAPAENELYKQYRPRPWKVENLAFEIRGHIEVAMRKIADESAVQQKA